MIANVSIAAADKWKDKTTIEMKETTERYRISFNGRLAEIVGQYLKKGSQVYVVRSLRKRKRTDEDGIENSPPKSAPTRCGYWVAAKSWVARRRRMMLGATSYAPQRPACALAAAPRKGAPRR